MFNDRDRKIVAIDPSSQSTGLSLWHGDKLIKWEVCRASTHRRVKETGTDALIRRIESMGDMVSETLHDWGHVDVVVIEMPGSYGGKAGARAMLGMGLAIGYLYSTISRANYLLYPVEVSHWSRLGESKQTNKEARLELMLDEFDEKAKDEAIWSTAFERCTSTKKGAEDLVDAIMLGAWFQGVLAGKNNFIEISAN